MEKSEYLNQESASSPLNYGIIANVSYPFAFIGPSDDTQKNSAYINMNFDIYYDCWQIGFHRNFMGDLIEIQPRTYGKDIYTAFYFGIGSTDVVFEEETTNLEKGTLMILGQNSITKLGTNFISMMNIAAGVFKHKNESYFTLLSEYGIGYRIPIATTAAIIYLKVGFDLLPTTERIRRITNITTKFTPALPVNFGISYNINFENI
jgi:hypothetical protein